MQKKKNKTTKNKTKVKKLTMKSINKENKLKSSNRILNPPKIGKTSAKFRRYVNISNPK